MSMKNDVLIVVPARLKSQRLSEKLLRTIGDKSVLLHVCHSLLPCSAYARVIVATDSELIWQHVTEAGFKALMTSPLHHCGTERCAEAASLVQNIRWVVNVQGDEPFIDPNDIIHLINSLSEGHADIVSLYTSLSDGDLTDQNSVKVSLDNNNYATDFFRETAVDQNKMRRHIGVYGFKNSVLQDLVTLPQSKLEIERRLEQMRWIENGYKIKLIEAKTKSVSIDTMEDLIVARQIYHNQMSFKLEN